MFLNKEVKPSDIVDQDYICCLYADAEDDRLCVRDRCLFNLGKAYCFCVLFSFFICAVIILSYYFLKSN